MIPRLFFYGLYVSLALSQVEEIRMTCDMVLCPGGYECVENPVNCVPISCEAATACASNKACVEKDVQCFTKPCPQFDCKDTCIVCAAVHPECELGCNICEVTQQTCDSCATATCQD